MRHIESWSVAFSKSDRLLAFDNLITRFSFSEPFFNPDIGQTQHVSAVFAANCDWTLQVQDASTNTVRYATGSGSSMRFDWDGNGTNGVYLPAGNYTYLLSVQTNGQQMLMVTNGGGDPSAPPSPSILNDQDTELWALAPGAAETPVPLVLYPPGYDTNGFTVFEASRSEIMLFTKVALASTVSSTVRLSGNLTTSITSGASPSPDGLASAASQSTRGPSRPPTNPVNRVVGKFGMAFQDYLPEMMSIQAPFNGLPGYPSAPRVQIQGSTGAANMPFVETIEEEDFIKTMARGAWQPGFVKKNTQLQAADLRKASCGGANIFSVSNVSLGVLSLHGAYGTKPDYDQRSGANGATQIYFPIDQRPATPEYVRMSELDFGSPGTNGLKWMALVACNSLRQDNWNSIRNTGLWKPFNGNLHLLLGGNSIIDNGNERMWAKYLLGLDGNAKYPIIDAWQRSSNWCLRQPVTFAAAGFTDWQGDMLTGTNSYTPQGAVFWKPLPVLP